jgi:hypothetical protein
MSFSLSLDGVSCLRRMGSKLAGPFAGGMEDTNQLHDIATHAIRNYVRRSGDHQLTGTGYPAGPTEGRKMFHSLDCSYDCGHGPGSSIGIVLGDVL